MKAQNKASFGILLFIIFLVSFIQAQETKPILLKNNIWTISIVPSTLEISAKPNDKTGFPISWQQLKLGPIQKFQQSKDHLQWEFSQKGLAVSIQLNKDNLEIHLVSKDTGNFIFPLIQEKENLKALILPRWEGCYIPIKDSTWIDYLIDYGEWNTTGGLSLPFWGLDCGDYTLTYIITNPYNNKILFSKNDKNLQFQFTHEFPPNNIKKEYGFVIKLGEHYSPVEPAKQYRDWLIANHQFVSMKEKMKTVPNVERLLGAPHVYLWGDNLFTRHDIPSNKWKGFCLKLISQSTSDTPSPGKHIKELISPDQWKQIIEISTMQYPYDFLKNEVTTEISRVLQLPNFYDEESWQGIQLPEETNNLLKQKDTLNMAELCKLNCLLFYSAFPEYLFKVEDWGDGVSVKMLKQFQDAGFDRMILCVAGWEGIEKKPEVAIAADKMGYLLGTYDSFFSIHDPKYKGSNSSWSTAQFDQHLYDTGGMENINGEKLTGFKKFGYKLNPVIARPYVEDRVKNNMKNVAYTYYFIDADAFGEVFDDYSPAHPLTQEGYAQAMMDRLAWIRDTYKVVIGSEGGSAYSVPVIHVAEGMFGPGFGWGDPDLSNKTSIFYMGSYFPPDGPRVFTQQVPIKDKYYYLYYDPRFRLPLYETVFHDSVVATNHWGGGSLKFNNILDILELTELLYMVPPLYHMNLDEFKKYKEVMKKHYVFFSPLHKELGFSPMTDFVWLTPNHLIQKTEFANQVELVANYSQQPFDYQGTQIPSRSILAKWKENGKTEIYSPASTPHPNENINR